MSKSMILLITIFALWVVLIVVNNNTTKKENDKSFKLDPNTELRGGMLA